MGKENLNLTHVSLSLCLEYNSIIFRVNNLRECGAWVRDVGEARAH